MASIVAEVVVVKVISAEPLTSALIVELAAALDVKLALSRLLVELLMLGAALSDKRADVLTLSVSLCCGVVVPLVLALPVSPLTVASSLADVDGLGVDGASDGVVVDDKETLVVTVAPPLVELLCIEIVAATESLALELDDLLMLALVVSLEVTDAVPSGLGLADPQADDVRTALAVLKSVALTLQLAQLAVCVTLTTVLALDAALSDVLALGDGLKERVAVMLWVRVTVTLDDPLRDVIAVTDGALALGDNVDAELTELVPLAVAVPRTVALPNGALGVTVANAEMVSIALDAEISPLAVTFDVIDGFLVAVVPAVLDPDTDFAADSVTIVEDDAPDEAVTTDALGDADAITLALTHSLRTALRVTELVTHDAVGLLVVLPPPAVALTLALADAHALPRALTLMLLLTVAVTHPLCDAAVVLVKTDADAHALVSAVGEMSAELEPRTVALCVSDAALLGDVDGEVVALAPDALSLCAALADAAAVAESDNVKALETEAVPVAEASGVGETEPLAKALLLAGSDAAEDSEDVAVSAGDTVPTGDADGCALADALAHVVALVRELAVKWLALGVPLSTVDRVLVTDTVAVPELHRETVRCAVGVAPRVALADTDELVDGDADALPLTRALADPLGETDGEPENRTERDTLDVIDEVCVKTPERVALAREDAVGTSTVREGDTRGERDALTLPLSVAVTETDARDAVGRDDCVAHADAVTVAVIEKVGNDGNAERDALTVMTAVRDSVAVAHALARPLPEPDTEAMEMLARALSVAAALRDAVPHDEVERDGELVSHVEKEGEAEIEDEAEPDGVTEAQRDTRALRLTDGVAL